MYVKTENIEITKTEKRKCSPEYREHDEKAPEEAERGSALRISSPGKKASQGESAACVSFRGAGPSSRSAKTQTRDVRRAGTWQKICRLPAGVQARRVPGRTLAGPKSSVRPIGGPCGVRQSPIEHACLRQSPIEQDLHGRDAHECVQHPGASAHSWCERKTLKTVPYQFNAAEARAG